MAKHYKTDGTIKEIEPKNKKHFTLKESQAFVGGLIEIVYLKDSQIMIVNEEGKINNLPINVKATDLIRSQGIRDIIAGNAFVCDTKQIR